MTKEAILARLDLLETQREKLIFNVNAFNGAIEESRYWLAQLSDEITEKKEEANLG